MRLDEWRGRREPWVARLERAVARLERALDGLARPNAPEWLRTEVLAIQACLAGGLVGDAAERAERLARRVERGA